MKKIFILSLIALAALSCKKDETLRYNNITMGNIEGEVIISDQGNTFNIAESLYQVELANYERALISCDVLSETGEKTYDIRLNSIIRVLDKEVKTMDDSTEEEDLNIDDPIMINEVWYSGGYLNIDIEFFFKAGSETPHFINLIHETSEEGKHIFTLRHNALGELPYETLSDETFYLSRGYVSYPISRVIEGNSADIILNWKSYKITPEGPSFVETHEISREYKWTRGGYEHAPRTFNAKSSAALR